MNEGAFNRRTRLHPLTPLLRGARMLAAVVAFISWQGYAELGLIRWLLSLAVALVIALGVSAVSWAVTGYQVVGRELRVHEGLLWRRTRAIPLERVQAVDVVRPLLARIFGLAELRLEVIGAARSEGHLAYLTVSEATTLRTRLLALVATHSATDAPPVALDKPAPAIPKAGQPGPGERPVHTVSNTTVLLGQLMTPPTWFVPLGVVMTAFPLFTQADWSFIGIASTLTALIGVVAVPARRVLAEWDFRISTDPAGLRLRHGLLDTRSQTIPPKRVQAIGVSWPLLWRPFGWLRSRIDVAGYGHRDAAIRAGILLPVGDTPVTRQVVNLVLASAVAPPTGDPPTTTLPDVATLPLSPPPARARWLAPLNQPVLGFALTDRLVAARRGLLTRQLVVVPLARVQSVRVQQGPLQRALRLATLHVDTAGALHVTAEYRDAAEAYALADAVARQARAARRAPIPAPAPAPSDARQAAAPAPADDVRDLH